MIFYKSRYFLKLISKVIVVSFMQFDVLVQTKVMTKRRVEDILSDESFKNKKVTK